MGKAGAAGETHGHFEFGAEDFDDAGDAEILRTELEMTMGLAGCTRLSQISPDFIINT